MTAATHTDPRPVQYRVTGMDCPACAAKIEGAVRKVAGVGQVKVSIASQIMTLTVKDPGVRLPEVERGVRDLGYQLSRLDSADGGLPKPPAHATSAYRRALWLVVLLNVGYGVVETAGGFLSGSQALKADALDFLGDGLITWLGLLAIRWSLEWRARSALVQGVFLGAMGTGVLASTVYRIWFQQQPEAGLMSVFGLIALGVNVAAALVLIPHRTGDANVRAVWLFSRNDAIGNAAVVAAAGLVAWTGMPWPDLAVALAIAGLFLHSSWSIVRDARGDLAQVRTGRQSF